MVFHNNLLSATIAQDTFDTSPPKRVSDFVARHGLHWNVLQNGVIKKRYKDFMVLRITGIREMIWQMTLGMETRVSEIGKTINLATTGGDKGHFTLTGAFV